MIHLQDWVRCRQQLVEMLSGEKNRLQQLKGRNKAVLKDEAEAHIEWLKDRIEQRGRCINISSTRVRRRKWL